jgi:hypothetical protein
MVKETFLQKHLKKIILVVVLAVVAVVALAFVPRTTPLGKEGTAVGTRKAEGMLRAGLAVKGAAKMAFLEEEVNAYVDPNRAKSFGVDSITTSLKQGVVFVRVIKRLGPIVVQGREIGLPMSFDVAYRSLPDGRTVVHSAAMGRLPLVGPLRTVAIGALKSAAAKDPEISKAIQRGSQYTFEDGKLSVVLSAQ